MHHGGNGADTVEAIETKNSLWNVGQAHQHPLAGAYAQGVEAACYLVDFLGQALVGSDFSHKRQGREVSLLGGRFQNGLRHGLFAVIQIGFYVTVVVQPRCCHVVQLVSHGQSISMGALAGRSMSSG